MKFEINTIDDFDVKGKTVLLRVDINQPVDKKTDTLKDITRIKGCVPTIQELSDKGAKLVILAHQGSDIEYHNYYNLSPHAKVISELINKKVEFIPDVCGPYAQNKIRNMKEGEIILLDNVRFMAEEMTLFETKLNLSVEQMKQTQVVKKLSPLADLFVVDAFAAAHRAQPTLMGFCYNLKSAMGRLFELEYSILSQVLENPKKPLVFLLGGTKIGDAFCMMDKVLKEGIADKILTGGLVAQVMLAASGFDIGKPSLDFIYEKNLNEYIEKSKILLKEYDERIMLPVDLAYKQIERKEVDVKNLPVNESLLDIGHKTVEMYKEEINNAKTVFVNGPVGVFENVATEYGTKTLLEALAKSDAFCALGGGDSVAATNKYGLADKIGYVCTGGGAMVRFLSGEELPVVSALKYSAKTF
jgi:phosphoglycerate kinase